jgi:hypothetical protein
MPSTGSELDAVRLVADCLRPRRLHLSASGKTRSSAISSYPRSLSAQSAAATSSQSAAGAVGWCSCFSPASEVSPNPSGAHQQCQVVRCAPTVPTSNFVAPEFPDKFSDRLSWFVVIWFGLVVRYPVCTASGPQLHGSLGSTGLRPMPPHYYRDLAHGPGVGSGLLPQLPPPTWDLFVLRLLCCGLPAPTRRLFFRSAIRDCLSSNVSFFYPRLFDTLSLPLRKLVCWAVHLVHFGH